MSFYEQLIGNSEFLRGVTSEAANSSDPYPAQDFLARFQKNLDAVCLRAQDKRAAQVADVTVDQN